MLNKKSDFALQVLACVARFCDANPVTSHQVAQALSSSISYVEQALKLLREADFVSSIKGPRGGYVSTAKLYKVSVGEFAQCFAGTESDHKPARAALSTEAQLAQQLADQADAIGRDFLLAYPLHTLITSLPMPTLLATPKAPKGLVFGFKPLPKPSLPKGPNSIFDLPRYIEQWHTAAA